MMALIQIPDEYVEPLLGAIKWAVFLSDRDAAGPRLTLPERRALLLLRTVLATRAKIAAREAIEDGQVGR